MSAALLNRRQFLVGAGALLAGGLACRTARWSVPRNHRVVVVGAGLSGLVVAHELMKRGVDVLVLEATTGPGGRIRTVRSFRGGLYVEAGATHVVGDPDLMALIDELGVQQAAPIRKRLARVDFRSGVRRVFAPGQEPPPEHELSMEEELLGAEGRSRRYFEVVDRIDPRTLRWPADIAALDRVTGAEWLRGMGASTGFIANTGAMFPLGDGIETLSALSVARELASMRDEIRGLGARSLGRIAGGTDHLPRAIASRLGHRVVCGAAVQRIDRRVDHAILSVRDATGTHQIHASRVVLTMPFTVLRSIEVTPAWSPAKRRAIAEINSTSITRVWLESDERFWSERNESGTADTDLAIGRVRDETESQPGQSGVLGLYLSGPAARGFGALPARARLQRVVDDVERVHPGMRLHFAGGTAVLWDQEPFARGAYPFFAPGQLTELAGVAAAPEGVVHFAGDGTSHRPGFMHGAVASAKRVVRELDAADAGTPGRVPS
jgi:monoamine oxidase